MQMHRCQGPPSLKVSATQIQLLQYYRKMYEMRQMENTADKMYKNKAIRGFLVSNYSSCGAVVCKRTDRFHVAPV